MSNGRRGVRVTLHTGTSDAGLVHKIDKSRMGSAKEKNDGSKTNYNESANNFKENTK